MELIYLFLIVLFIGLIVFRLKLLEKIIDIVIFVGTYSVLKWYYGEEQIYTVIILSITAFIISVLIRKLLMWRIKSS